MPSVKIQNKAWINVGVDNSKPNWIPFNQAKYGNFQQEQPILKNLFLENVFLQNYLQQYIPNEIYSEIETDLISFGEKIATNIDQLGLECERNQPYLRYKNGWDSHKTELVVCDAWNRQKAIAAEEGLISIGYNRNNNYGKWARLYQFCKLYLYGASSGLYLCPLAMTDGATKTIQSLNLMKDDPYFSEVFDNLTSRDPSKFWTSGQWMTEKGGGSDVANGTETIALPIDNSLKQYKLYGLKWFSSATDANIALTLARISDEHGNVVPGGKGLTLFYVPVKGNDGQIQPSINLVRLKNKLGTRQLPTAELLLDGCPAIKISEEGRGIQSISYMLQITRLYNAIGCASYIQKAFSLAKDYSQRRKAFGKNLIEWPLHIQTLSRIQMMANATMIFAFEDARLLDLIESGTATDEEKLLFRILNPLAKLYNSKVAIPTVSECIECIGGQGVIEDTGIPYLYRDVQIFSIWEGTTSVLSLDVLRSIIKSNGETLKAFKSNIENRLKPLLLRKDDSNVDEELKQTAQKVSLSLNESMKIILKNPMTLELGIRDFSITLSNLFISTLLLENVFLQQQQQLSSKFKNQEENNNYYKLQAIRFVHSQDLNPFITNYHLNEYSEYSSQAQQNQLLS